MTDSEPGTSSYSSRREAVSWTFEMLADRDLPRSARVRRAVLAVTAAAPTLGTVGGIRWNTEVTGATVELALEVEEPDGRTTVHPAGMAVHVASEDDGGVFLVVRLRTSAYADTTLDGDNRPVAALNRDRLHRFLSAVRSDLVLRLDDLESGFYRGQVDEHGFVAGPPGGPVGQDRPAGAPRPPAPGHARDQVAALVGAALSMTEERLAAAPAGPVRAMFGSIRDQLVFMRDLVAAGRSPTTDERNGLTLGVIAVREFEAGDLPYCDTICEAVLRFKRL